MGNDNPTVRQTSVLGDLRAELAAVAERLRVPLNDPGWARDDEARAVASALFHCEAAADELAAATGAPVPGDAVRRLARLRLAAQQIVLDATAIVEAGEVRR